MYFSRLIRLESSSIFIVVCTFIIYGACITRGDYSSKVKPILDKLNLTANPCEDFYEFVCGHLKTHEVSKTSSHFDLFQMIFDKTAAQMIKLSSEDIHPNEPRMYQLVKTYYQSCIDSTTVENRGLQPLLDTLKVLGGWPVVLGDSWNEDNFTWEQTDKNLRSLGYNPKYLFLIDVIKDEYDASKNILCVRVNVSESETYIKELRHHDYLLKAYKDYMVNTAVLLGAEKEDAIGELDETFQFEWNLWSVSHYAIEGISECMFDRLSIAELQEKYPYVQWLEYLNDLTSPYILSEDDLVCIENPTYLHAVENLLTKTPKRVIANYMIWRAIDASAKFLNKEIRDTRLLFTKACNGIKESRPDEERCIKLMMNKDNAMLPGISAMYVNNYFHKDTRDKVAEMVSVFKDTYGSVVQKSWLDDGTKVRALRKIALMKTMIGYPDELLDSVLVDNYYENLYLEPNKFYENSMKLRNFLYEYNINNLKRSPNDTFWLHAAVAAIVDAHYDVLHNAVASLVQYPNYDENQPDFMNYGNLGTIISHEITHGLTFGAFPWDEYGSKMRWWTTDDQNGYAKRTLCFIKQFQNNINDPYLARLTLAENVADTEALKVGFKAYQAWKKRRGEKGEFHHLNFTDEQLFWINTANFMCAKNSIEIQNSSLFTDAHAPENLRVNMGVANSIDFAKSFGCPLGSRMNPVEKYLNLLAIGSSRKTTKI